MRLGVGVGFGAFDRELLNTASATGKVVEDTVCSVENALRTEVGSGRIEDR